MALDFMGDWAYTILHPPKHLIQVGLFLQGKRLLDD